MAVILSNYGYPVDQATIIAYSAQLEDFEYGFASETLQTYCRTKPDLGKIPSSFELRDVLKRAIERKRDEERVKQFSLPQPKLDKQEVKQRLDEILKQTNLI